MQQAVFAGPHKCEIIDRRTRSASTSMMLTSLSRGMY